MGLSDIHHAGAAVDLGSAYHQLNPRLKRQLSEAELDRLYVVRTNHRQLLLLLAELERAVAGPTPLHALYVGPSGCGKSMDLAWLTRELGRRGALRSVAPIHFGIGDEVGLHEVGFTEVALAMTLRLHEAAPDAIAAPELLRVATWLHGDEPRVQAAERDASALATLIAAALRTKATRRDTVRIGLQPRVGELHDLLAELLTAFAEKTGRTPAFIIDDLEKISPVSAALELFLNQAGFLASLPCHLLLTAPNALCLEERYTAEVLVHFREYRLIQAFPGYKGKLSVEADRLRAIVYRRMAPELIATEALDQALVETGGVVAQLIEVLQRATVEATVDGLTQIGSPQMAAALRAEQTRYSGMLKSEDYVVLERIGDRGLPSDVRRPALLHNLSVLEYPDSPTWVGVHPLVAPLVRRWRDTEELRERNRGPDDRS